VNEHPSDNLPYLSMRVEGPDVSAARMRLQDFVDLSRELMIAVERVGFVLQGSGDSMRHRRRANDFKQALSLDLVGFTHGSPAAVAQFERTPGRQDIMDAEACELGDRAYSSWLTGLSALEDTGAALPSGYDIGVLLKMRDVGKLFKRGINRIDFTLNHREVPIQCAYTPAMVSRVEARIARPEDLQSTIEGRLVMVDFRDTGAKFRVHPPVGDPVYCEFDRTFQDEVRDNVLQFVRVQGNAKLNEAGNVTAIKIANIEALEEPEGMSADIPPTTSGEDFWQHHGVDVLADAQGVSPIDDARALLGGWPDDTDDGFDDALAAMRSLEGERRDG